MRNILVFSICLLLGACARPIAKFTTTSESNVAAEQVEFENLSENGETYLWNFGDGTTSIDKNPSHTYYSSGNYNVELIVKKGEKERRVEKRVLVKAPEECMVLIQTTYGDMVAVLYDDTPKHRDNFIKLIERSYYDSLLFHRVIDGFMIQGGDPDSKGAAKGKRLGSGGPSYRIPNEIEAGHAHIKGALAAARTNNPKKESSGSQFYIVDGNKLSDEMLDSFSARSGFKYSEDQRASYLELGGTPFLDGEYTVFGKVIQGLDVIDKIAEVKRDKSDRPEEDVIMLIKVID